MGLGTSAWNLKTVFHAEPSEKTSRQNDDLVARARDALYPVSIHIEHDPTIGEWIRELKPTKAGIVSYVRGIFPSAGWIGRYNFHWLLGDAIAGLTIGFVVVPQAMAYALLARLTPEYGLYTSFVGAVLYWLFGTSRDIVIGTTAVGSLLVGRVVTKVQEEHPGAYTAEEIAKALSTLSGMTLLFLGLFRLGWLIEFIPYIPISAFVTAASVTIISTQLPVLLGVTGVNTREAPYLVLINTLKSLAGTKLDAAIGLTCILLLVTIKEGCAAMETRQPLRKRFWVTMASLRQVFAMLLYTLVSFAVHHDMAEGQSRFRIVGKIEAGFSHTGVPRPSAELLSAILPELPAVAIILIIEHIAIAKSFGRISNYTIAPSQEIVALGAANLFSPFVGGYVCTGSFGASAVLSKAGVRSPLAGLFSAMLLVLALYALTTVFYFIPMAALAGLIIHAVCNLMTRPQSLYRYWQLSPFELFIWVVGVILAVFQSLENSIYATIGLSAVLLLVRLSRSRGRFMGRVRVRRFSGGSSSKLCRPCGPSDCSRTERRGSEQEQDRSRVVYLPLDRKDGSNPNVAIDSPYPGVFIYRFTEGFNYTNQAKHITQLLTHVLANTRRTTEEKYDHQSDRLWCDPGPAIEDGNFRQQFPLLRAIVLDCSAVNNIDITSVQGLIDLRNSLDQYAAPEIVDWHFASLYSGWARRTLAVAGFGYPSTEKLEALGNWKPAYNLAALPAPGDDSDHGRNSTQTEGKETSDGDAMAAVREGDGDIINVPRSRLATVNGVNRPYFHIDLVDAVTAATRNAVDKDSEGFA